MIHEQDLIYLKALSSFLGNRLSSYMQYLTFSMQAQIDTLQLKGLKLVVLIGSEGLSVFHRAADINLNQSRYDVQVLTL